MMFLLHLTTYYTVHGQIGGIFASEAAEEVTYQPLNRWQRIQELTRHFRRTWLQEWIPSPTPRQKWQQLRNNMKIGGVVLMMMSDTSRAHWPLA